MVVVVGGSGSGGGSDDDDGGGSGGGGEMKTEKNTDKEFLSGKNAMNYAMQ